MRGSIPFMWAILLSILVGCISPGVIQRKNRKLRGEETVKYRTPEQEYRDFMDHVRPVEPN